MSNTLQIGPNVNDSQNDSLTIAYIPFLVSAQIVIRSSRTGRGCEKPINNHCQDVKVMAGEATGKAGVETAVVWSRHAMFNQQRARFPEHTYFMCADLSAAVKSFLLVLYGIQEPRK